MLKTNYEKVYNNILRACEKSGRKARGNDKRDKNINLNFFTFI